MRWINNQSVISEEGWSFQRAHRFYYFYCEGDHKLQIFVDAEEVFLNMDPKWMDPFEKDPITESEWSKIKVRVKSALRFMKLKYKTVEHKKPYKNQDRR